MTRLLLFISLVFSSVIAHTTPLVEPLSIELSHRTDATCTNHYTDTDSAIPGGCIQYQIQLTNHSPDTLRNLSITGKIPQHTQLHQAPSLIAENQIAESLPYTIEKGTVQKGKILHVTLTELLPSTVQATIIQYHVKIDE